MGGFLYLYIFFLRGGEQYDGTNITNITSRWQIHGIN